MFYEGSTLVFQILELFSKNRNSKMSKLSLKIKGFFGIVVCPGSGPVSNDFLLACYLVSRTR